MYYLQPDALGSARVAIDPVRDVAVWRWDLSGDAFGASPPQEDPDGDGIRFTLNLRFPGQQYDAATGLHYNYYRDYDPTVGRYVQSDPIGLLGGMSTYGYANLSPGSFTDPLGLKGKGLGGRIGQALFSPIYQRLGGGAAARAASMAAKARAEARRAADMAKRMRTVLGRIFKDRSKKGAEPAGCDDVVNLPRVKNVEFAGGPQEYVPDLGHLTGKGPQARNRAIDSIIKEDFPGLNFTHHPRYSPFVRTGVAQEGVGTQIGKMNFLSRSRLRNVIVHEELHHRWWARGVTDHHPAGSAREFRFYETIRRYERMRGWVE